RRRTRMFDIGFGELLLVAVVALVVLGPERLPKAARFAGLWVRRARAQWYSVRAELERELEADELKRSLQETQQSLRQAEAALRQEAESARTGLVDLRRQVQEDTALPADPPAAAAAPPEDTVEADRLPAPADADAVTPQAATGQGSAAAPPAPAREVDDEPPRP